LCVPLYESVVYSFSLVIIFVFLFLFIELVKFLNLNFKYNDTSKYNIKFMIFGLFALFVGVLPYAMVGKVVTFMNWENRQGLLTGIGVAFVLYYGLKEVYNYFDIKNGKTKIFIYITLIFSFMIFNIKIYVDFQKDWYKQL